MRIPDIGKAMGAKQNRFSRREILYGASMVVAAGMVVSCTDKEVPVERKFNSIDLTGADYAKDFTLTDHHGKARTLKDFRGKIVAVFFGFTQCPDVCPTKMAELSEVKWLLGPDADKLQAIFITVDPERDTPLLVEAYMRNFDPTFLALRPSPRNWLRWPATSRFITRRWTAASPAFIRWITPLAPSFLTREATSGFTVGMAAAPSLSPRIFSFSSKGRSGMPAMTHPPRAWALYAAAFLFLLTGPAWSSSAKQQNQALTKPAKAVNQDGKAEARLVEVYRLIGAGNSHAALSSAQALVKDYPNFQLAQLIYGDLLTAHNRPVRALGDFAGDLPPDAASRLQELREESRLRLLALRERPPKDGVPTQLLSLSPRNKHAIAVDVSKSRLYLFENGGNGPRLLADYYISVGKAGVDKKTEGDQRTPLGIYFITSNLDPKSLKDLYGSGALPINYPNALDVRRGRGGSGIWLHGTPSSQFSRAPHATDGCVAVANPDLDRIIRTVEIRTTPVVISRNLKWVTPQSMSSEKTRFEEVLQSWVKVKSAGEFAQFSGFYAEDFTADEKTLAIHGALKRNSSTTAVAKNIKLSDISLLQWTEESGLVVATFGEVIAGEKSGRTIRQYWERRKAQWKIVYEGVVG